MGRYGFTLAVFGLCCLLGGCAQNKRPMSLGEFYGFCWPAQVDTQCDDDSLCSDFRDYLAQDHAGRQACIEGCQALNTQKYMALPLRGCDYAINSATDWCTDYCRRYYDQPQTGEGPAQPSGPGQP
jgi:hypothetical protein